MNLLNANFKDKNTSMAIPIENASPFRLILSKIKWTDLWKRLNGSLSLGCFSTLLWLVLVFSGVVIYLPAGTKHWWLFLSFSFIPTPGYGALSEVDRVKSLLVLKPSCSSQQKSPVLEILWYLFFLPLLRVRDKEYGFVCNFSNNGFRWNWK